MSTAAQSLLVIIPTRNRAYLAETAIRSVLDQRELNVRLIVSDNSTEDIEVNRLGEFCRKLGEERLRYLRPPRPLPMVQHWEWALEQGLSDDSITHVSYLTDRLAFKRESLSKLRRLSAAYPENVISYRNDVVFDHFSPVQLIQVGWSGKLYELQSADILKAVAAVSDWVFFTCTPRMLNCVVPRGVFGSIAARFGNVFLSQAPDLCFAFRCLETVDSILYYDKALFVGHGHNRSSGTSYIRGLMNKDYEDFLAEMNGKRLNHAAPMPEFATGTNAVIHEYCFAKKESQSPKFPEVDMKKYLDTIASEIVIIENPQLKREMELLIERHRSQLTDNGEKIAPAQLHERGQNVGRFSPSRLTSAEGRRGLWSSLQRRLGLETPGSRDKMPKFETAEAALSYNALHPRAQNLGSSLVENRIPARELPQDW